MESIDIVIPWVDESDPVWIAERDKYKGAAAKIQETGNQQFRDWDTLKYVFRGIEKFMPWVRCVHFLTYGHLPSWLNTNNSKIRIHKHADFFSKESVLPVFNSQAIEMNLRNIPDLSEKFIYFNDDTLVCKTVTPDRFFKDNLPVDYLVLDIPRGGWLYDKIRIKDSYAYVVKNNISALNKFFPFKLLRKEHPELFFDNSYKLADRLRNQLLSAIGLFKWVKVNHHPQGLLLSNLNKCYSLLKEEMDFTSRSRFRSAQELNQYVFRNIALMSGQFYPHYFDDSFCIVLSSIANYEKERKELFSKTFVCINDSSFLPQQQYPELKKLVHEDLQSLFPEKSDFEK